VNGAAGARGRIHRRWGRVNRVMNEQRMVLRDEVVLS
jgi:hypothetical protein